MLTGPPPKKKNYSHGPIERKEREREREREGGEREREREEKGKEKITLRSWAHEEKSVFPTI